MVDLNTLILFIPMALALNITPGADMMFCLGQGAKSGPWAGVAAALGVSAGGMVHAFAGGIGLAAVIATSPYMFEIIRWGGVAYLLYLAFRALTAGATDLAPEHVKGMTARKAFTDGMLVNLLNPKVAIFVLAFVPQFVDPDGGSVLSQFLIFGVVLGIGGTLVNGSVGAFSGHIRRGLSAYPNGPMILNRVTGLVFVGLAAKLALDQR